MAVRHSTRRPAGSSPSAPPRRTKAQRLYDDVAALERQLKSLMDEIPYSILGRDPQTCQWLGAADTHLQDVVAVLQKVHDREAPRYNRSAQATTL
jgi:hypothetical protein